MLLDIIKKSISILDAEIKSSTKSFNGDCVNIVVKDYDTTTRIKFVHHIKFQHYQKSNNLKAYRLINGVVVDTVISAPDTKNIFDSVCKLIENFNTASSQ